MSIQDFLNDFLPYDQQIFSIDLYDKYKIWCLEFNQRPIVKVNFCKFLINKGYEQKKIQINKIRKNGFDFSKNIKVYLPDKTSFFHHIALYDKENNKVIHDIYNSTVESVEWKLFKYNNKITHDFIGLHCSFDKSTKCIKILNDTKTFDILTDTFKNIISLCDPNYTSRFNFCN